MFDLWVERHRDSSEKEKHGLPGRCVGTRASFQIATVNNDRERGPAARYIPSEAGINDCQEEV
jgi:hypothetical protein